jgi:hypothetical protein
VAGGVTSFSRVAPSFDGVSVMRRFFIRIQPLGWANFLVFLRSVGATLGVLLARSRLLLPQYRFNLPSSD